LSGFVGLAPAVRLRIRNLPFSVSYPSRGSVEAIVDTGYEGFLLVPRRVFDALSLDEMMTQARTVEVADGRRVRSRVAYGTVELEGAKHETDGPIETIEGLTEVLVGTRLLSEYRVTLDYCLRVASIKPCG
jgi:clan AA aspartic protease